MTTSIFLQAARRKDRKGDEGPGLDFNRASLPAEGSKNAWQTCHDAA